jgi:hypothetical protein
METDMAMHKNIFWRPDMDHTGREDGLFFANVHLLVGYNQQSIADYRAMAKILRETFPNLHDFDLHCLKVTKSTYCCNFSLLTYNGRIPHGDYPDWRQSTCADGQGGPDYSF